MKAEFNVRDVEIRLHDKDNVVKYVFDHDLGYFVAVKSESENETSESQTEF